MELTKEVIRKMMHSIHNTRDHELSCGECFEEIDRFAELELAGKNAQDALPLVKDHLERCGGCKEEYLALLDALRAMVE
jgi:hypothetical protein